MLCMWKVPCLSLRIFSALGQTNERFIVCSLFDALLLFYAYCLSISNIQEYEGEHVGTLWWRQLRPRSAWPCSLLAWFPPSTHLSPVFFFLYLPLAACSSQHRSVDTEYSRYFFFILYKLGLPCVRVNAVVHKINQFC